MADDYIQVTMTEKIVKEHSVRYNSEDPELKSIYIPKIALRNIFGEYPGKIRVTITRLED